jgi:hypothetical protein
MEAEEMPRVPIDFKSMVKFMKDRNNPFDQEESLGGVLQFLDTLFQSANIVFDQQAEPRGFASAEEEQAIATCLSIMLTITRGLRAGQLSGVKGYLDVLNEVEHDAVWAYELLVASQDNAALDPGIDHPDAGADTRSNDDQE